MYNQHRGISFVNVLNDDHMFYYQGGLRFLPEFCFFFKILFKVENIAFSSGNSRLISSLQLVVFSLPVPTPVFFFFFFCVLMILASCQIWSPVALINSTVCVRLYSVPFSLSSRVEGFGQVCCLSSA